MDYGYMSMERVMKLVERLRQPMVYQGPEMGEPVVVLPLAEYERLVGGEIGEMSMSENQPSLFSSSQKGPIPFGGASGSIKELDFAQNEEKNAYISENRRLLEAIAQFSAREAGSELGMTEPKTVPLPVIEETILLETIESEAVDGLELEERFYLETMQNG